MLNSEVKRDFLPGEEWIYFKIYCSSKTADFVLKDIVKPLANILKERNVIEKWFFIRYGDPDFHIRVRFLVVNLSYLSVVFQNFSNRLIELYNENLIWGIQVDTYVRELERYGSSTIVISEDFFFLDSELILDLLINVIQDNEEFRWQISLLIINNILSNFNYSMNEKLMFIEKLNKSFGSEFPIDKSIKKQLDIKYRKHRVDIHKIMTRLNGENSHFYAFIDKFNSDSHYIFREILNKRKSNELEVNFDSLVSSFIHMSMVRLFKSKNRLHELVVYDFLLKYYKTCMARGIVT
jgi:thiopeptide-type bacteriocin biosynthesis protein